MKMYILALAILLSGGLVALEIHKVAHICVL